VLVCSAFEAIHQGRTDRSCEATIVTSVQATDRECGPRGWAWSRTQAFVAVEYFFKSPSDLHERLVIVISPVLATANTAVAAVDRLKERGANDIRLVSVIGVPKGVERMRGIHPDAPIWLAAIDEGLDSNAYIFCQVSDAGDRAYGN
jgi:uracil phosphoribosyltransferase